MGHEPGDDVWPNPGERLASRQHREMLQADANFRRALEDARIAARHPSDERRKAGHGNDLIIRIDNREQGCVEARWTGGSAADP